MVAVAIVKCEDSNEFSRLSRLNVSHMGVRVGLEHQDQEDGHNWSKTVSPGHDRTIAVKTSE